MQIFDIVYQDLDQIDAEQFLLQFREPKDKKIGIPFDGEMIKSIFAKAEKELGCFYFRRDIADRCIALHDYGRKNKFGWEVDHIIPVSKGGTDDISNLQPLHWESYLMKGEE